MGCRQIHVHWVGEEKLREESRWLAHKHREIKVRQHFSLAEASVENSVPVYLHMAAFQPHYSCSNIEFSWAPNDLGNISVLLHWTPFARLGKWANGIWIQLLSHYYVLLLRYVCPTKKIDMFQKKSHRKSVMVSTELHRHGMIFMPSAVWKILVLNSGLVWIVRIIKCVQFLGRQ